MKRQAAWLLAACACLTLEVVPAAGDKKPTENPAHAELRKIRDQIKEAVNQNKPELIMPHLHPNVVVTWMDGQVSHGPKEVQAYYDKMMSGPDSKVESVKVDPVPEGLSDLYGDQGLIDADDVTTPARLAVSYGHSNDDFKLRHGLAFSLKTRWTATLVKEKGRWLITSFHASAPLFDNPLRDLDRRMMYIAGGVGAVVGVLLGFLIGRFSMRRSAPPLPPAPPLPRSFP